MPTVQQKLINSVNRLSDLSPNYHAKQTGLAISNRDSVSSARGIPLEKIMLND